MSGWLEVGGTAALAKGHPSHLLDQGLEGPQARGMVGFQGMYCY